MRPLLRTSEIEKRFGDVLALSGVGLSVGSGEVLGLIGLNGAGKTTMARILATATTPTGGHFEVAGYRSDVDAEQLRTRIGVVFGENFLAEPDASPLRYLRHFGRLHGWTYREANDRAHELLRAFLTPTEVSRPTRTLSGGNRRKVEIARALLNRPPVLVLDEPTRELDIPSKLAVHAAIREASQQGNAVLIATHDVQEIQSVCDRIMVLRRGSITWEGTAESLGPDAAGVLEKILREGSPGPPPLT